MESTTTKRLDTVLELLGFTGHAVARRRSGVFLGRR
jgi:hypothetical protein